MTSPVCSSCRDPAQYDSLQQRLGTEHRRAAAGKTAMHNSGFKLNSPQGSGDKLEG